MNKIDRNDHAAISRCWGSLEGDIVIAPSVVLHAEDPSTGLGELHSITYVLGILQRRYRPERLHVCTRCSCATCDRQSAHHILLGGSASNPAADFWAKKLGISLFPERQHGVYADFPNWNKEDAGDQSPGWWGTVFTLSPNSHSSVIHRDHGVAIWHYDVNLERRTVFCVGSHTYGTYAATAVCFSGPFARVTTDYTEDQFVILASIDGAESLCDSSIQHPITFLGLSVDGRTIENAEIPATIMNHADLKSVLNNFFWEPFHDARTKQRLWAMAVMFLIGCFLVQLLAALIAYYHHIP
jgi:hypothetical protein